MLFLSQKLLSVQQQAGSQLLSNLLVSCLALSASLLELRHCCLMLLVLSASDGLAGLAFLVFRKCLAQLLSSMYAALPLSCLVAVWLLNLNIVFTDFKSG